MTSYLRRLRALPLLLLFVLPALAAAAPVQTGSVSAASPTFTWTGGPLSGGNLAGEPCGTTHQCEDVLLHVGDGGQLEIAWKASSPSDQGWLNMSLYKSDAEGNAQGDAVAGTGAFDNQGALLATVEAGDYIVRAEALLSVAATYEATATLTQGEDPGGIRPRAAGREHVRLVQAGGRRVAPGLHRGAGRHGAARGHPSPRRHAGRPEDAGHPLDRPLLQPHGPDRPGGPDAGDLLRPVRDARPVQPVRGLHPRRGRHPQGLHVGPGRPARVRRQHGLPRLERPGRAGRRRRRRRMGGLAAVVDRQGRDVRQVVRRRHRPAGRDPQPEGPGRRRRAGAGLRHVPVPVRGRHPLPELPRDTRALRRDRGHARQRRGRARLLHRQRQHDGAARLRGAQLGRPAGLEPRLAVLA